jgi:hypothetical protein
MNNWINHYITAVIKNVYCTSYNYNFFVLSKKFKYLIYKIKFQVNHYFKRYILNRQILHALCKQLMYTTNRIVIFSLFKIEYAFDYIYLVILNVILC